MCSRIFDLRQTQPHQQDRTRNMLQQPLGVGFAAAERERDLKELTAQHPSWDMAAFKDPSTGEFCVLAIRGGCYHRQRIAIPQYHVAWSHSHCASSPTSRCQFPHRNISV